MFYRCALGCDMDCGKRGEHARSFPSLEGSADFERCPSLVRERKARLNGRRAGRLERSLRTAAMLVLAIGLWWLYEAQQASFGPLSSLAGPVTRVRDGDTIEVSGRAVRLKGIACEERGTALGEKAAAEVRAIVEGRVLSCVLTEERSYDRAIGWCRLADGRDLGELLVARRVCGRCPRYDPFRKYAAAQRDAGAFAGTQPPYCWAPW